MGGPRGVQANYRNKDLVFHYKSYIGGIGHSVGGRSLGRMMDGVRSTLVVKKNVIQYYNNYSPDWPYCGGLTATCPPHTNACCQGVKPNTWNCYDNTTHFCCPQPSGQVCPTGKKCPTGPGQPCI